MKPPAGGWTQEEFLERGQAMLTALVISSRHVRAAAGKKLEAWYRALFTHQVASVCEYMRGGKALNEGQWGQALQNILGSRADVVVIDRATPVYQSTIAQAYARVNSLLGEQQAHRVSDAIARDARELAQQVTRINDTTRARMERVIRDSIADGDSVTGTIDKLSGEELDGINARRAATIARTETQRAWDAGAKRSFRGSKNVTHVSVIGCEAREARSPQYHGESTCNIKDVPIEDLDKLRFHPNHTGTIVPSRFIKQAVATTANPREVQARLEREQAESRANAAGKENQRTTPAVYQEGLGRLPKEIREHPRYPQILVNDQDRTSVFIPQGNGALRMTTKDDWRATEKYLHNMGHWAAREYNVVRTAGTRADFKAVIGASKEALKVAPDWARVTGAAFPAFKYAGAGKHYDQLPSSRYNQDAIEAMSVIAALTGGRMGAGHTKEYLRTHNNAAKEVFASAFAGSLLYRKNGYLLALFPELMEFMDEFTGSLE